MPYANFTTDNGYIRIAYMPSYNYDTDAVAWSIPLTYDLWF
jgi:hypothetical protein